MNNMISKNNTALDTLLSNLFKYRLFNNCDDINFNRIKINSSNDMMILNCLFSKFARSQKILDTMLGIELSEKSVFMLSNGDDIVSNTSLSDIANIDEKEQLLTPKERLSCDFFVFNGGTLVEEKSNNSLFNLYSFASELKDLNIKLHNSREYHLESSECIYAFYDALCVLNKISNNISSIDFLVNYNGNIQITLSSLENPSFNFIIEANNIVHLNELLKNIDLDNFINFLIENQLSLIYKDNLLECKKLSKVNVFYFDSLKVKFNDEYFKYLIKNINAVEVDIRYIPFKAHLTIISELFELSTIDIKLKIFKSIFSNEKHQNLQYQEITDQEIADMHHSTKNNIVETYKKRKVEQYEILRLGTTCKKMGITENELLELIAICGLERFAVNSKQPAKKVENDNEHY